MEAVQHPQTKWNLRQLAQQHGEKDVAIGGKVERFLVEDTPDAPAGQANEDKPVQAPLGERVQIKNAGQTRQRHVGGNSECKSWQRITNQQQSY
jgi:hypothetical protein